MIMKSGLAGERWFVAEVTSPFSAVTFCAEALVSNWSSSNFGPNFKGQVVKVVPMNISSLRTDYLPFRDLFLFLLR